MVLFVYVLGEVILFGLLGHHVLGPLRLLGDHVRDLRAHTCLGYHLISGHVALAAGK